MKLQEFDDLLDVCVLLLLRDVIWLPQVSGEPHRLTDGGRAFVYIHLFGVGGSTSEIATEGSSINEKIASNDTDILPLSKDVEASGLPGARSTHESGHRTGLDITVNVVKESKISTRDGDGVIDMFPGESFVVIEGRLLLGLDFLLFDRLGDLPLLAESRIEFSGLLRLLGEDGKAKTAKCRPLGVRILLATVTKARLQKVTHLEVLDSNNLCKDEEEEPADDDEEVPPPQIVHIQRKPSLDVIRSTDDA